MDIGDDTSIGLVGFVSFDTTRTFTLWGSGVNIGGTRDAFRFVYQPLSANGFIEVTIKSHSAFASCAKASTMMRESFSPFSPFITLGLSPADDGVFVQGRQYNETQLFIKRKLSPPYRLRLVRKGDTWMTQIATQQNLWETLVENTITLARDVYLSLAVTSCDPFVVSVAKSS